MRIKGKTVERIRPVRHCGKFICLDGIKHEWLFLLFKTLINYFMVCFFNKKLEEDIQNQFVQIPSFPNRSIEPRITWIGHSTFLIQIAGKNIITDPIFGSLSFIFRRLVPAAIKITDLPPIDYVLISHNHYDHMNSASLHDIKKRFPKVKVLVPMGDKKWFDMHNFENAFEYMWWDEFVDPVVKDLKFTFLPANHWTQRTLFDKNKSLWGSWMIQISTFKIYFAGDTSWGHHFDQIGKEFKDIDIACMPIAPVEPREFMEDHHIDSREAVKAFIKLRAKIFIPMHWGTFHLGFDDFYTPIKLLKKSWQEFKDDLRYKELKIVKFGEVVKGVSQKFIFAIKSSSKETSL